MGCDVYANNNEIACKAGDNKVIADMPDVCLSPPSPPAGPVPVPYPDTSFSKDMQSGSKTVMIKGQEVMLKDQSFYKTSPLGDEAATNSFGGNVVSHVITGKTYFLAWSMDVKFEGQNVDRHLDITTSNNASPMSTTAPGPSLATMTPAQKAAAGHQQIAKPPCAHDAHQWVCDTKNCADCWDKPCQDNADHENTKYHDSQSGSQKDKIDKQNAALDKQIAQKQAAGDTKGAAGYQWEKDAMAKAEANNETIEYSQYFAHCSVCHFVQEVDMVTDTAIKECKMVSDKVDLGQMKRYAGIQKACFDKPPKKKRVVVVVPKGSELARVQRKLAAPDWKNLGITAEDP